MLIFPLPGYIWSWEKATCLIFKVLLRNNIKYFNYIFLWNEGNIGHELPIEYSWAIDHM